MELVEIVLTLAFGAAFVWAAVTIVGKAGYNEWLGLLVLVPFVNVVAVIVFAVADWPVRRAARRGPRA